MKAHALRSARTAPQTCRQLGHPPASAGQGEERGGVSAARPHAGVHGRLPHWRSRRNGNRPRFERDSRDTWNTASRGEAGAAHCPLRLPPRITKTSSTSPCSAKICARHAASRHTRPDTARTPRRRMLARPAGAGVGYIGSRDTHLLQGLLIGARRRTYRRGGRSSVLP
eukprot:1796307-Prymnesium_polylepis.1